MFHGFKNFIMHKKSNLFTLLLVSYLIILLIPISIGSISYVVSFNLVKEQVKNYNISLLEQSKLVIDGYLYEIDQLVANAALDAKIQNVLQIQNPITPDEILAISEARDKLAVYTSLNTFIDELYIYLKNSDIIITPTGKYSPTLYYQHVVPYTRWDYNTWKNMHNYTYNRRCLPCENISMPNISKKVLTYFQSLPLGSNYHISGTVGVLINIKKIEHVLKNINLLNQGVICIIDDSNNIIMNIGKQTLLDNKLYWELNDREASFYSEISGNEVLISHISSNITQWKYISIIPTQIIKTKTNYIKTITVAIIALELNIGLVVSFFLARKNYLPIKRITDRLKNKAGSNRSNIKNELTFIEDIMNTTLGENEHIKEMMKKQQALIQHSALIQLINGSFSVNTQNIGEFYKSTGIYFNFDWFCVLTIVIDSHGEIAKSNSLEDRVLSRFVITNVFKELLDKDYIIYSVEIYSNRFAIIINIKHNDSEHVKNIRQVIYLATKYIEEKFNIHTTVGVGTIQRGADKINTSFVEGTKAAEYRKFGKQGQIIFFEDLRYTNEEYTYSTNIELQILNCIKAGEIDKVTSLIDEIFALNFKNVELSIEMARCLFFDLMSTGLKTLSEINIRYNTGFEKGFDPINEILGCNTIDELYKTLNILFGRLCQYISKSKKSHNDILKEKILNYINEQFCDYNLSLTSIASVFNMNPTYLSSFFKEQIGVNFIDYVNSLRIQKAKVLLRNTSLSLSQIADKIGYTDRSYLTKKFKQSEGITPSHYREHVKGS